MKIIEPKMEVEKFDGKAIMKRLERACRTCYRSEGSITDESYKTLLNNCITRGHESILEHEKITIRMTCDIGVYKDLTRHRIASFSVESTRYCSYNKDKYGNDGLIPVTVDWIDKEAPTAEFEFNTTHLTDGAVIATLKPSEDVTVTNNGTLDAKLEDIKETLISKNEALKISFDGFIKGEKLYKNTYYAKHL